MTVAKLAALIKAAYHLFWTEQSSDQPLLSRTHSEKALLK